MSNDALSAFASRTIATPQTQPVPGRTDMVRNHSGGYVFDKNKWDKLKDFLVLGTEGNTFYLGRDQLTAENATNVLDLAASASNDVVNVVLEMSTAIPVRVPSNRGCMFALAAVQALGSPDGVQAVKAVAPQMARTTDYLAMFFGYRKALKSKTTSRGRGIVSSRAFRATLTACLVTGDPNSAAFRACKARQRKTPAGEAMTLQDIIRIAHPSMKAIERAAEQQILLREADAAWPDAEKNSQVQDGTDALEVLIAQRVMLIRWLAGKATDAEAAGILPAAENFMIAKAVATPAEAIRVVTERRVPWEFLPSEVTSDKNVWEVLAHTVGITALIRNLAHMTRLGTIAPFASVNKEIVKRLTNQEAILKGRVHPMNAYLALRVYASGTSQPNPKAPVQTWSPVAEIMDALEETYELAFGTTQPSGRKTITAVDSSGSMSGNRVIMGGSSLGTPYEVGCAVATIIKRIEGDNTYCIDVDGAVHDSKISKRTSFREIRNWCPSGGTTDLSLPMRYAMQNNLQVDGFTVLTDNVTWSGQQHPFQALNEYRSRFSPHARFADVAMLPYGYGLMEPGAPGVLNMAGMDASLPTVLSGFFRGAE